MSDLQKRLQEQNAANRKTLAYKQANAKAVRAGQKEKAKRPDQPAEETKGKKPVAVLDDEGTFKFIFTSCVYDNRRSGFPDEQRNKIERFAIDYISLIRDFGDAWEIGVVELQGEPDWLQRFNWPLTRLGEVAASPPSQVSDYYSAQLTAAEYRSFLSALEFQDRQPEIVDSFSVFSGPTTSLADGFIGDLDGATSGDSNAALCFQDVKPWRVPLWPVSIGGQTFTPSVLGFGEDVKQYFFPYRIRESLTGLSVLEGPVVGLQTHRPAVVKACQEASDNGMLIVYFWQLWYEGISVSIRNPFRSGYPIRYSSTVNDEPVYHMDECYTSGADVLQRAVGPIDDLIELNLNVLDFGRQITTDNNWNTDDFLDYVRNHYAVASRLEAAFDDAPKVLLVFNHDYGGPNSCFSHYPMQGNYSYYSSFVGLENEAETPLYVFRRILAFLTEFADLTPSVGVDDPSAMQAGMAERGASDDDIYKATELVRIRKVMAKRIYSSLLGEDAVAYLENPAAFASDPRRLQ